MSGFDELLAITGIGVKTMTIDQMKPIDLSEPTGRQLRCDECHKSLDRPLPHITSVVCANCGTSKAIPPALASDESDLSILAASATENRTVAGLDDDDVDSEFMLRIDAGRPRAVSVNTASLAMSVHAELDGKDEEYSLRFAASETVARSRDYATSKSQAGSESRVDQARSSYNETSGIYPHERHYPTLESMQRIYKIFGYAAVLIVFPYLGFRFLYILSTVKEGLLAQLGEFSEFAVPLLFGCVAFTASLFGLSEGIKLVMDIQDNTLRIANRHGRKKID